MKSQVLVPGRNVRKKKGWGGGWEAQATWLIMTPLPRPWPLWVTCTQTPLPGATRSLGTPNGLFPPLFLLLLLLSFLSCRQLFRSVTNLPNLGGASRVPRLPLNRLTDPRVSFLFS